MPTREDIVAEARTWVGTPFQHLTRVKGIGVDCVGLVIAIADDLGIKDNDGKPFLRDDYRAYPTQPSDRFVHDECCRRLVRKSVNDLCQGDIVSLKVPRTACHVAIITERQGVLYMIHGYSPLRKVVEHILDNSFRRRIIGVFSYPGVTEVSPSHV